MPEFIAETRPVFLADAENRSVCQRQTLVLEGLNIVEVYQICLVYADKPEIPEFFFNIIQFIIEFV